MINNAVLVSVVQKSDSVAHTHVSVLFQTLFPFRLLHNIEQSSLRSTVCPCWLSILSIAVCTCWSQTPWLSSPTLFPTGNCKFVLLLPIFLFLFNYEVWDNVWAILGSLQRKALSPLTCVSVCWPGLASGHSQPWSRLFKLKVETLVESDDEVCGLILDNLGLNSGFIMYYLNYLVSQIPIC